MNWWQTLIVAVVPVLLTLIITNTAESRRRKQDATERERDRDAERQAREAARRASIEDHWRNERLDRMSALVDVVGDLVIVAERLRDEWQRAGWVLPERMQDTMQAIELAASAMWEKTESDLPRAVTSVALISSQKFYLELLSIVEQIRKAAGPATLRGRLVLATGATREKLQERQDETFDLADEMARLNAHLTDQVREELTEDRESLARVRAGESGVQDSR